MAEKKKDVVIVDPQLWMERQLHYNERHAGWRIFRSVYWSIYLLIVGFFLLSYSSLGLSPQVFFGMDLILLAVMVIVFGLVQALHHKLMKRYG